MSLFEAGSIKRVQSCPILEDYLLQSERGGFLSSDKTPKFWNGFLSDRVSATCETTTTEHLIFHKIWVLL